MVPIMSLPESLQEEIMHWVFRNEDRSLCVCVCVLLIRYLPYLKAANEVDKLIFAVFVAINFIRICFFFGKLTMCYSYMYFMTQIE